MNMNLTTGWRPKPTLSEEEVNRGMRMLLWEGSASLGMFSVTTSGLLAAYALALGANNLQIGILAAIPFLSQLIQVPGILLVERLRWRKAIAVVNWTPAQLMWVPMALVPFFIGAPSQAAVALLLALMAIRGVPAALSNCSWNSWVRDLVPQDVLGRFFAQPKTVVITTPNVEYNIRFENLQDGAFRHRDHRFEWTRAEFRDWAQRPINASRRLLSAWRG